MVEQIDARLVAFRMAKVPALADVDFDLARERTAQAARAVRDGHRRLLALGGNEVSTQAKEEQR